MCFMTEVPISLSAVSLRLAGDAGQAALNRISAAGAAAAAELDQHIAAVRDGLAGCQRAMTSAQQPPQSIAAAAAIVGFCAAREHAAARRAGRDDVLAAAGSPATIACPDVPFAADALAGDAVLALRLLLYYACGFVEAAVSADWWPGGAGQPDWQSVRLAAVCQLISQAETAAEIHPDLRALAQ
jgi:hypothetical protein